MDQTLIYFLIACVVWAALLFYVFVVREAADLGAGGKSSLVIISALLIPTLGFVLWNQSRSFDRLSELGFTVYHGFDSAVGVATGTGADPSWLYSLSTSEKDVIDFYRRPEHHIGWILSAETSRSLVFERGSSKLILDVSNGNAAFVLFYTGELKAKE